MYVTIYDIKHKSSIEQVSTPLEIFGVRLLLQ